MNDEFEKHKIGHKLESDIQTLVEYLMLSLFQRFDATYSPEIGIELAEIDEHPFLSHQEISFWINMLYLCMSECISYPSPAKPTFDDEKWFKKEILGTIVKFNATCEEVRMQILGLLAANCLERIKHELPCMIASVSILQDPESCVYRKLVRKLHIVEPVQI